MRTGEQQAASDSQDIKDKLSFLRTFLFVFAGIALFVGAFLIANTFSITVAQRVREFALLRMIGANRRQVLRAVVGEALLIGFVGAVVGFLAGFAIAPGLKALFKLFGADLPSSGIVLLPRTVIVSLLLGTIITLVSALSPALRATRVPPMAALQEAASLPRGRAARWRTPLAAVVARARRRAPVPRAVRLGEAAATRPRSSAPARPSSSSASACSRRTSCARCRWRSALPLERLRGVSGRLARENAARNPRRTASTSAALMIGVALVAFMTIFAAGLKASIADAVDVGLKGQLIAQTTNFSADTGRGARRARIGRGRRHRLGRALHEGDRRRRGQTERDRRRPGRRSATSSTSTGSTARPRRCASSDPGEVLLSKRWAEDHDLGVGDALRVTTPTGARLDAKVIGIYDDDANLLGDAHVLERRAGDATSTSEATRS